MSRRVVDEKIIDMCIANLKRGDDKDEVNAVLAGLDPNNYYYIVRKLIENIKPSTQSSYEFPPRPYELPHQIKTKRTRLVSFPFKFEVGDSFCIYDTNNDFLFAKDFHDQAKREKIEITTQHEIGSDGKINLKVTRTA